MPAPPPITLTPRILTQVAEIGELVGRWEARGALSPSPQLRRENRIRTIQASLAIENNSLGIDQVSDILDGKRVLGHPREIQEVRNAIQCYDRFDQWKPTSVEDFLTAHALMMRGLVDHPGSFRSGVVGIYRGEELVHMAPPADRVAHLIATLFRWLEVTDHHPLIASSILHYEIGFIHPFADGNGRMGRLWQSVALAVWHPELAWLPVETLIRENQDKYYEALGESDQRTDSAPFVEFILGAIRNTLAVESTADQVSDQVKFLLKAFGRESELSSEELMMRLGLRHKPTFRKNYLHPALAAGWLEMTEPASPRSPTQRYRITKHSSIDTLPHR